MMNTDLEIQTLNAFIDDELDLASRLEMEGRMQRDAGLRAQVEGLRQWRKTLREGADYHAAPAALRRRVLMAAEPQPHPQPPVPARLSTAQAAVRRWLGARALGLSLGVVVLALVANLVRLQGVQSERLMEDVVASHVRSTLGQHLVDVASSERHTVKPWLSSKLDFSPPVPGLQTSGAEFLGGRVDYLDGHPVAALVYRQRAHVVNSFVWPATAADSRAEFSLQRGFQIAHWSRSGMQHWVISDLSREEFFAFVAALEAAESER